MRGAESAAIASGAATPAEEDSCAPACLLRMSRGFSCLFWSLPLLSTAHVMALMSFFPPRGMIGLWLACFLPLACGLWMLWACGDGTPRWRARTVHVSWLALVALGLCPFLVWWRAAPEKLYFAANAAVHYVSVVGLLAGLNRLAAERARRMNDKALRREAQAGLVMVLWLSACTVGALVWLFQRAGILAAGVRTVLLHLSQLQDEAHMLFLLPYAMTAYVMWRAKETGFRRAAGPAP